MGGGLPWVDGGRQRNAEAQQFIWIKLALILPHETADGGHFRNAGYGFELVPQVPVLKRSKVGEAVLARVIHECIFIDPPRAGCIRTDSRMYTLWQPPGNGRQGLKYARPHPT